jgi:hypothetical protein
MMELVAYAEHESPVVYIERERERSFIDKRRMLMLSLQYLLQRCARGGRMIVDDSGGHVLRDAMLRAARLCWYQLSIIYKFNTL